MKKLFILTALITCALYTKAQTVHTPPPGNNRKAMVAENIGITQVTINYDRPGVKGREGKIYGTPVVHEGFQDLGFGTSKAAPWRAGANENTTIEFSTDVKVEGENLPAGKYGFFVAYGAAECIVIFSRNSTSWGSFFYNESEDALRIKVKPVLMEKSVEWLKYEFINQSETAATIALQWEKTMIPFRVEVNYVKTQLENFRLALRNKEGFKWETIEEAASFCSANNTNLEEGLDWSNTAVLYQKNFQTLNTNAGLLEKLGKKAKADSVMKEALAIGNMTDLHLYGRKLLAQKKNAEALEIFKMNAKKNPKKFMTYAGLTRGYSANGDFKNALASAKSALDLAPDAVNKTSIENMIKKLEKGQDVN